MELAGILGSDQRLDSGAESPKLHLQNRLLVTAIHASALMTQR